MPDFGVRVFPSSSSNQMRHSIAVLHYAPMYEPPIDYTLKEKSKPSADRRQLSSIPWTTEHITRIYQPEQAKWSKGLARSDAGVDTILRRESKDTEAAGTRQRRIDTADETAMVLEDLDNVLDTEELTLKQRMSRLEGPRSDFTLSSKLKMNLDDAFKSSDATNSADKIERQKAMVAKAYRETERRIEEAIRSYTPEYFKKTKLWSPTMPSWKSELLARKMSNETTREIEEKAWREFSEWKRRYAPTISVHPTWRFKRQPMLS